MIGSLADSFGLRSAMLVRYLTFGWVGAASFWARQLILNETISGTAHPKRLQQTSLQS
jgi:hypothetical protein